MGEIAHVFTKISNSARALGPTVAVRCEGCRGHAATTGRHPISKRTTPIASCPHTVPCRQMGRIKLITAALAMLALVAATPAVADAITTADAAASPSAQPADAASAAATPGVLADGGPAAATAADPLPAAPAPPQAGPAADAPAAASQPAAATDAAPAAAAAPAAPAPTADAAPAPVAPAPEPAAADDADPAASPAAGAAPVTPKWGCAESETEFNGGECVPAANLCLATLLPLKNVSSPPALNLQEIVLTSSATGKPIAWNDLNVRTPCTAWLQASARLTQPSPFGTHQHQPASANGQHRSPARATGLARASATACMFAPQLVRPPDA